MRYGVLYVCVCVFNKYELLFYSSKIYSYLCRFPLIAGTSSTCERQYRIWWLWPSLQVHIWSCLTGSPFPGHDRDSAQVGEGRRRQTSHPFFLGEHIHTKGFLGSVHISHEQGRERFCGLFSQESCICLKGPHLKEVEELITWGCTNVFRGRA